jgi:predicted RNA-binding protein with PUA-like domain
VKYWLIKSEPSTWSWNDQVKKKTTNWDGVRNHQAAKNLKTMKKGDRAFFYHSGDDKAIVGIVEIVKEACPDPSDDEEKFVMVGVKALEPLSKPVTLAQIRATPALKDMALLRQSRLSVQPVSMAEWKVILKLAGVQV